MSNLKDRAAARILTARAQLLPLVPDRIRALYADELAHIPQVRVTVRKAGSSNQLPAVGSFFG